jgi:hypothetical protein
MSDSTSDIPAPARADEDVPVQPLRDGDTSLTADPDADAAQREWARTEALDAGADPSELDAGTATGDDPSHLRGDDQEIPAVDQPSDGLQPESQGDDPVAIELGEDGQGDLAPEDL